MLPVDGPLSCVFEFTVDWTSPSLGTVEFTLNLNMNSTGFPGYNDEPIPLSFPNPELPLSGNYTALLMEYPPESLVATLDVALTWDYGSGTLTLTDQASQSYGTM